jgi:hypothetical protein
MTQPQTNIFPKAASLAADLAGARVDPNEAQKALAYLRSKRDTKLFFAYLRGIVSDGRAVIRSRQTLDYYRDLLGACERHLRGMEAKEMALALGWAIRLLRYYRAVPDGEIARPSAASHEPLHDAQPKQSEIPAPPPRTALQLPAVGDVFTGKVIEADESAVLVEVPGFAADKAVGVIKAEVLGGKRFVKGNMARVEVVGARTLKSGRVILDLKPRAKKEG